MIEHEDDVFKAISNRLREEYGVNDIYIIGEELSNTPPRFPAVCIMQSDDIINTKYSTFKENENVVIESYKVEVVSNDSEYGKEECKKIIGIVNEILVNAGYLRTFNQSIKSADSTINRRIARFRNSNSI